MKTKIVLNDKEQKLIELIRKIGYGQVRVEIFLEGYKPVRIVVEGVKESFML